MLLDWLRHRDFSRVTLTCCVLVSAAITAQAQSELETPESVIKAYMAVPSARWQDRLPFVANAERARPIMAKWYADRAVASATDVESFVFSGDTDPSLYRDVGDSRQVVASLDAGGTKQNFDFVIVRTQQGFQLDWLMTLKPKLLAEGLWEDGRLADAKDLPEIAVKHLEAVGERYENKPVRMLSVRFDDIDNGHITSVPGVMVSSNGLVTRYDKKAAEAWVGFRITDRNGKLGFYFFAPKEKWADMLLDMKRDQLLNLVGVVTPMEHSTNYGLLVYDIEVLKP